MAEIRSLFGELPTVAFLENAKNEVPQNAPCIVMHMDSDGRPTIRTNNCTRRDMVWLANFLIATATITEFHEQAKKE